MSKVGRILLLLIVFFTIAGATHQTSASTKTTQASTCSPLVVTPILCSVGYSKLCPSPAKTPEAKQVQSAVVIASLKNTQLVETKMSPTTSEEKPQPQSVLAVSNTYASDSAVLDSEKIFELVNQYRVSKGLAPFEHDNQVCELAQIRSQELAGEAYNGTIHSGLYNRNLPYWIWENAKYGSNEEGTVAWWLSSPIHHQSIIGDYKYSCVKCTGSYCVQLFTSFSPK